MRLPAKKAQCVNEALKTLKERYGDKFDPSEQIVSPQALFKSKLLKKVHYSEF